MKKSQIERAAEAQDFTCSITMQRKGQYYCEFSSQTRLGQNVVVGVCSNTLHNIGYEVYDYYQDYDTDQETYLWLDDTGHGKNGAPYSMLDIHKDMEEAESKILCLAKELSTICGYPYLTSRDFC